MRKKHCNYLLMLGLAAVIGCSGFDNTQVLIHPDDVKPSAVFDVVLVNIFTFLDSSTTISGRVVRDSLHLLIGLPESWNVTDAAMVVAKDLTAGELFAGRDNLLDELEIAALLQQYRNQTVALPVNEALSAQISGDTVSAHNRNSDKEDIQVITDKVKTWKGFSAPVNIVLEKGAKPDSLFPFDTAMNFASEAGFIDDSTIAAIKGMQNNPLLSTMIPDTIGMTMVPVAVFLKVQAGPGEGSDTLYYFSKTGKMNPAPSSEVTLAAVLAPQLVPRLSALEYGDMTYIPVTVSNAAAVGTVHRTSSLSMARVITDRYGNVHIDLGNLNYEDAYASIYSLQGALVASLSAEGRSSIAWDGAADGHGNRVRSGSYIVLIGDRMHGVSTSINFVK
jgi:hypothetical protein